MMHCLPSVVYYARLIALSLPHETCTVVTNTGRSAPEKCVQSEIILCDHSFVYELSHVSVVFIPLLKTIHHPTVLPYMPVN